MGLRDREGSVGFVARIAHSITVLTSPTKREQSNIENINKFETKNRILFLFSLLNKNEKFELIKCLLEQAPDNYFVKLNPREAVTSG